MFGKIEKTKWERSHLSLILILCLICVILSACSKKKDDPDADELELVSAASINTTASTEDSNKGIITEAYVNVRSSPETDKDNKIGTLAKGNSVEILEETDGWYKIQYKCDAGYAYVSSQFVNTDPNAAPETGEVVFTPLAKSTKGTVTKDGVLLRKTPEAAGDNKIKMMKKGDTVTVVETSTDWYKVQYKKTSSGFAYISTQFVSLSNAVDDAAFVAFGEKKKGTIVDNGVFVRKTPEVSELNKIKMLNKGDTVTVVAQASGWYKIQYKTSTGYAYISSQFVTFASDTSADTGFTPLPAKKKGTVNTNGVYVRKKPDTTKDSKIKMLAQGTSVTVVAQASGWYKIEYNKSSTGYAYIASQFVSLPADAATAEASIIDLAEPEKGTIAKKGVIVRSAPEISDKTKITTLKKGATVTVIGKSSEWCKIEYNTDTGYAYIAAQFVVTGVSSDTSSEPDTSSEADTSSHA